uniref:Beta-amylase n=1 Tax=Oryza punctata TaxID=4537 RepID=A0A0E0LLU6_ORYPU
MDGADLTARQRTLVRRLPLAKSVRSDATRPGDSIPLACRPVLPHRFSPAAPCFPLIPGRALSCSTGRLKVVEAADTEVPYVSGAVSVALEGDKSRPASSLCASSSAPVKPASFSSVPA